MSLLRTSRLAAGLTKNAVFGLAARGLWAASKAAVKRPFRTAGIVGGPVAAGVGVNESMKSSKEDMSTEGFGQRMGYGGG